MGRTWGKEHRFWWYSETQLGIYKLGFIKLNEMILEIENLCLNIDVRVENYCNEL